MTINSKRKKKKTLKKSSHSTISFTFLWSLITFFCFYSCNIYLRKESIRACLVGITIWGEWKLVSTELNKVWSKPHTKSYQIVILVCYSLLSKQHVLGFYIKITDLGLFLIIYFLNQTSQHWKPYKDKKSWDVVLYGNKWVNYIEAIN